MMNIRTCATKSNVHLFWILLLAAVPINSYAQVIVQDGFSVDGDQYIYKYRMCNTGTTSIVEFDLLSTSEVLSISAPAGWIGASLTFGGQNGVTWGVADFESDLLPGEWLEGFEITSTAVPGQIRFEAADAYASFRGTTIGPAIVPIPLLALSFEGTMVGDEGEIPGVAQGVSFEDAVVGRGAKFGVHNQVYYDATGNIDAREGALDLWIRPNWNGGDGKTYVILANGVAGGMLFARDGANNLRSIFNRFGVDGQAEVGVATNVGSWTAGACHHVAYTWSNTNKRLRLYVDGALIAQESFLIDLPLVASTQFQLGAEGAEAYLESTLDELRIAGTELDAVSVARQWISGLVVSLADCLEGPGRASPQRCACADLNDDGYVDLRDFVGFQNSVTGP